MMNVWQSMLLPIAMHNDECACDNAELSKLFDIYYSHT